MSENLKYVAPDAAGSGSHTNPGSVSQIPEWLNATNLLHVVLLPGNYRQNVRLSNVNEKWLLLEGPSWGRSRAVFHESSIVLDKCKNVTIRGIHFRQTNLSWRMGFLSLATCIDCRIEHCSWVETASSFGTATIKNESERIAVVDCKFQSTGHRESTGSSAHQLYIAGNPDRATSGFARGIYITRCEFIDSCGGQHLKFKNGARDCFVTQCVFRRTKPEAFGTFIRIDDVGNATDPYPRVTGIYFLRNRFTNSSREPTRAVNPGPIGRPTQYVFAHNTSRRVTVPSSV